MNVFATVTIMVSLLLALVQGSQNWLWPSVHGLLVLSPEQLEVGQMISIQVCLCNILQRFVASQPCIRPFLLHLVTMYCTALYLHLIMVTIPVIEICL